MIVEKALMGLLVGVMLFFIILGFIGIYIKKNRELNRKNKEQLYQVQGANEPGSSGRKS